MMRFVWAAVAAALLAGVPAARSQVPLHPGTPGILQWTAAQQRAWYPAMQTVYRMATIRRGDYVRPLPRAARRIDPTWTHAGRTWTIGAYMKAYDVSGLLVLQDGKVLLERYGLGRKPADRWTSFSVAKSVTSTLIGAAIEDGYIKSLDDPVTRYIPRLKGSAYDGVTVRQLLTMTSGVKWNENYTDPNSDVARAGTRILQPGVDPIVSYMRRLPRAYAPGTRWVYKTGETDLAGILVSNATGKSLSEYASEKIWRPFGMERNALWMLDLGGHERGGCCISMTLRDYGRFGLFMLDGGLARGRRILPKWWVAQATSPQAGAGAPPPGYGYFWWMEPHGYAAEGIFGQAVVIYPKDRLVVVFNSAWPQADADALWAAQSACAEAIRAAAAKVPSRGGRAKAASVSAAASGA
ncbi:MAG TPA: serine hydrolase [Caulobacteraceae bacterium]|nr:serine hydrolase [Caulobacteraceae bacterium]